MKKLSLIIGIVCSLIVITSMVTLISSSVQIAYAENHYEATYVNKPYNSSGFFTSYGSGCGDMDCKYCNGKEFQKAYGEFVFYHTMSSLKTTSIVLLSVFGALTLGAFAVFVIFQLKEKNKNN